MKLHRHLFSAALLILMGSTIAGASVLPSGGFPALLTVDVPEPGTVVLLGSALLGAVGFARRKSKS
ncbi:MAG: PEP-CTERM sorting domain-containing protein [Acidobacteriia bacterium]|nr:PEP-CTERM sorting domain-containing protein [Terriglobia bacterium]